MNYTELIVFILYQIGMLGIGLYFFTKHRNKGEKSYFLGDRQVSGLVAALSAGASDMSSWVLMGLPGALYLTGLVEIWTAVGLALGQALSWILVSQRLRRFSIAAKDSITIPQYLTNRFLSGNKVLQILCAVIFLLAYAIYAASSIKACGTLFNTVLGVNATGAMILAAVIIVSYTFLGGFSAVYWTDFFQGMLMLIALIATPIVALAALQTGKGADAHAVQAGYWSLTGGAGGWAGVKGILSGLAWGLGYFGMPHIIIRYMSIRSEKECRRSAVIGSSWTTLILLFSVFTGLIGFRYFGNSLENNELVFIQLVRSLFPALISGILLSAILAASMSTADSQLLASASAFASDVYQPVFRKGQAKDKEMLLVGRIVVVIITIVALLIALLDKKGSIMSLVSNAWGIFGAAFGPAIILSLYWRRFNFPGAIASIAGGAVLDLVWLYAVKPAVGLYELLPAFIFSLLIGVVVTLLTKAPDAQVTELFDKAKAGHDL